MEVSEVKEICKQVDSIWNTLDRVLDCSHYWKDVYKQCRQNIVRGREFSGYSKFYFSVGYEVKMAIIRQFSHFQNGDTPDLKLYNSSPVYIYSAYALFAEFKNRLDSQNITVSDELAEFYPSGKN